MSYKNNDFERIFVFYDEKNFQYVENLRKVKLLEEKVKFGGKDVSVLNGIKK